MTDVQLLKLLPPNLLGRLETEIYAPVLIVHAFFSCPHDADDFSLNCICGLATSEQSLTRGEELFRLGMLGSKMYFLSMAL